MDGADSTHRGPGETSLHLRRALEGDGAELGALVERLTPWLLAQARERLGRGLGTALEPEDVVQEAWSIVLPRLGELEAREGRHLPVLLRFLATTSLQVVNNQRRRSLRRNEAPLGSDVPRAKSPFEPTLGVVTRVARGEASRELLQQLDALEEEPRRIVVLRGIEQHSTAFVAEQLGLTPNAVSLRYRRALGKLRDRLSPELLGALGSHAADGE